MKSWQLIVCSSPFAVGCSQSLFQKVLLVASCWLLVGAAKAQDWKIYPANTLQATYGYYFEGLENSNRTIPEFSSQHELKLQYKTNFTAFTEVRSIVNQHDKQRRRIWLNQGYLAFNKSIFYGKVGKQIVKWGSLTGLSALDLANRYDYYDFIRTDQETLGVWGADAKLNLKKVQFQFRALPFNNTSRLYFNQNRWIR
ncbi:MAG: hypothetical protein AAGJ18_29910, partial [Bacteroidota bacterium]